MCVGEERGIGVLAAVEQGRAANVGDGVFAVEIQKQLIAHHGAAGRKGERVEARSGPDRRRQRRDVQRVRAFADDLDVIDMRPVADKQFQRRVDLIVAAGGTFMALDQHGPRARLDDDQRTHKARRRLCPKQRRRRCSGRSMVAPAATRMTAPSPISAVLSATATSLGRREFAEVRGDRASLSASASPSETIERPGSSAAVSDNSGHECAVDENQPAALDIAEHLPAQSSAARFGGGIGRARRAAWRRASARADRCISSPRRGGAAGLLWRTRRTPLARCSAIGASPGRRGAPARMRRASAVSAAVFITFTSAIAFIR